MVKKFFSRPVAETLGSSANTFSIYTLLRVYRINLINPRTASATRALLRLHPCHRAYPSPPEGKF